MHLDFDLDLVLRIVVGTLLGSVIGYERDIHGRPAGLRTHALVALASSTFMVVSTRVVYFQHYHEGDFAEVDGTRIAASVVSASAFSPAARSFGPASRCRASRRPRASGSWPRSGSRRGAACTSRASSRR